MNANDCQVRNSCRSTISYRNLKSLHLQSRLLHLKVDPDSVLSPVPQRVLTETATSQMPLIGNILVSFGCLGNLKILKLLATCRLPLTCMGTLRLRHNT